MFRDVTFLTAGNRLDLNIVAVFKVRNKKLPVPFMLYDLDFREFVHFELLVFWGMGIIKSPLFERDISANKVNLPAVLAIKVLNCLD